MPLRLTRLILTLLVLLASAPSASLAATLTVNTTTDADDAVPGDGLCFTGFFTNIGGFIGPACTLRAAITEANALAGADTIEFHGQLPTVASVVEFYPQSALPTITDTLTIDGASAAGYDPAEPFDTPIIQLGGAQSNALWALRFAEGSDGSTVRALAVHGFDTWGIVAWPDDINETISGLTIEGCQVGISRGVFYTGNGDIGIYFRHVTNSTIGGICDDVSCSGKGNVVSANGGAGITLVASVGVHVVGNRIGTNTFGTATFVPFGGSTPNGSYGIVTALGGRNTIGSTHEAGGNLISGNSSGGIRLASDQNFVLGNRIGTNRQGTAALPNQGPGIYVTGGGNFIGRPDAGNLVSGNDDYGIHVLDRTTIAHNVVGLTADQSQALGNERSGIRVEGSGSLIQDNVVGENGSLLVDSGIEAFGTGHDILSNIVGTNANGLNLGNAGRGIMADGTDIRIGGAGTGNVVGFGTVGIMAQNGSADVVIQGNWVGVHPDGGAMPQTYGIAIAGDDTLVGDLGGLDNGLANVVGNSHQAGIELSTPANGAQILGNWIGTTPEGESIGTNGFGVRVLGAGPHAVGGWPDWDATQVAAGGNVIAHNQNGGIGLLQSWSEGVSVRGNFMYGHVDVPGVDLAADGITPNDFGDVDTGSNRLQNTPHFDLAQTNANEVTGDLEVRYRVNTNEGDATYPLTVDFHLRGAYDEEVGTYLGSDTYPAASATLFRSVALTPLIDIEDVEGVLVATATDADGNSSEISTQWVPVPEPGVSLGVVFGALFLTCARSGRQSGRSAPR